VIKDPRHGAEIPGHITSLEKDNPKFTFYKYGKGKAIYTGRPGRGKTLSGFVDDSISELYVKIGPNVLVV